MANTENSACENAGKTRVIPTLVLKGADKALELYKKAFGATEQYRMMCPVSGVLAHASLKIGETELFVTEERPEMDVVAAKNLSFYIYVPNVDDFMKSAVKAGLKEDEAPQDMFWGDRMGTLTDSYGISWNVGTHMRDVSEQEMAEAMKKMASKAA